MVAVAHQCTRAQREVQPPAAVVCTMHVNVRTNSCTKSYSPMVCNESRRLSRLSPGSCGCKESGRASTTTALRHQGRTCRSPLWGQELRARAMARTEFPKCIIPAINFKGGTGKTTVTIALAEGLCRQLRKRVLIIDCDFQCSASIALLGRHALNHLIALNATLDCQLERQVKIGRA